MNEQEVKDCLWREFTEFMRGQTIGLNADGSSDYYERDVERFTRSWK